MSIVKIPRVAAHRGSAGGNIPCNSESAFLAALYQGADIMEIDISVAADGTLFVFHPGKEELYLNSPESIRDLTAAEVKKRRLINSDGAETQDSLMTFDECLELLKGKCVINVDKFWDAPQAIAQTLRRHNMMEQTIIKTYDDKEDIDMMEEVAPDAPYMVILRDEDNVTENLLKRKLNFIGIEANFESDKLDICSDEHIAYLHKNGLIIWGNAILYDYRTIMADCHSDDTAIKGNPDVGWGWFMDKGFDIVQTDWVGAIKQYYRKKAACK